MALLQAEKQPMTVIETEAISVNAPRFSVSAPRKTKINFIEDPEDPKIRLFCCGQHSAHTGDTLQPNNHPGQWCNREETLQFLKELPQEPTAPKEKWEQAYTFPSFTIIAGHGNGTLKPLSLDRDLFQQITSKLRLPTRIREIIPSIHGVFVKFIQEDTSLHIVLSTPKSPVREIFLAMRVRVVDGKYSVTCLLFDCEMSDLERIVCLIRTFVVGAGERNPLAFLIMILQDIGRTSEEKRDELDLKILEAEMKTHSTSWGDKSKLIVRWPEDSYQTMSALHICHNNLIFVARAIEVEENAWKKLRAMGIDENLGPHPRENADQNLKRTMLLDTIEYELAYTESRRAQIRGLKERVEVQINLIHNMMAHQEASQTNLIAIVALIFAPASLIASIFSMGIFEVNNRSWTIYIASTLPATFTTIAIGLLFLEQHRVKRICRNVFDFLRPASPQQDQFTEV